MIGFDDKPKGINPLVRLRSPGRAVNFTERNRLKPQGNMLFAKTGKHVGSKYAAPKLELEMSQSSGFSNPTVPTPKGQPLVRHGHVVSNAEDAGVRKKREDAEILNQHDMPSLQEYARQRTGRAALNGDRAGTKCSSP